MTKEGLLEAPGYTKTSNNIQLICIRIMGGKSKKILSKMH